MTAMQPHTWQRIEALFHAVLTLPPAERTAYLIEHATEPGLRGRVEDLLAGHESAHALLDAPPIDALPGGTLLGHYELLSIIGSGGMGTVYRARRADGQYAKQVAIKLIHQGVFDPGDRFERERQILANLEHPHIARLLDAGLSAYGQPYLVMELVEGTTLDRWAARHRPGADALLDLWEKIASAVSYAHRNLIVHRDLKPANVLVADDGSPKLIDFGIAKALIAGGDATQTLKFTPRYASPEQLRNLPVTTATDIYSLGIMLYELVTGQHPFPGADLSAPRAVSFACRVDDDLVAVIRMALRAEPERRYATADQFREDLRRYRRGLPVIAQPETRAYRVRRFVGRHRWGVLTASAAALALIGVASVAVVQARRATAQLARANTVSEFISGIMGVLPNDAPSSLRSKGASLKVVDLVESVAGRMDRDLKDQPEAEATIRYLAGSAYNQMGLFAKARPQAERSVALFSQQRAASDPERISAEILLGAVQAYQGDFARAERLLIETRKHWKSPAPYTVAALESVLGGVQLGLGKREAAEQTFEHCLRVMEAGLGPDNPWIGLVLSNLSLVYQGRGEWQRSRQLLERAVALARARANESPEALGWAALNLAIVERVLDRPAVVKSLAMESIAAFRAGLGEASPPAAQAMTQLAWASARLKEPEAERWAREAVAIEAAKLPPGHPEHAVGLTWLGYVLLQKDELTEARTTLERALEIRRGTAPSQDWRTHPATGFLGEVLVRQGETETGLALLREASKALTAQFGASNERTLDAQQRLVRLAPGAAAR